MNGAPQHDCPDCNSEQKWTMTAPNMYLLTIMHDNTCPFLLEYQNKLKEKHKK